METAATVVHNQEELDAAISSHQEWLSNREKGRRLRLITPVRFPANLRGANLSYAVLCTVDLTGANLSRVNLSRAYLIGANFCEAIFCGAILTDACVIAANFRGADLSYANFRGADFSGADFSGANFDYSSGISFGCTSFGFSADLRLAAQLAYHFCRIDFGDCEDANEAKKALKTLANKSHLLETYGLPAIGGV